MEREGVSRSRERVGDRHEGLSRRVATLRAAASLEERDRHLDRGRIASRGGSMERDLLAAGSMLRVAGRFVELGPDLDVDLLEAIEEGKAVDLDLASVTVDPATTGEEAHGRLGIDGHHPSGHFEKHLAFGAGGARALHERDAAPDLDPNLGALQTGGGQRATGRPVGFVAEAVHPRDGALEVLAQTVVVVVWQKAFGEDETGAPIAFRATPCCERPSPLLERV